MAVEAIDALLGVSGHLVFMHDGVLESRMTLGAFSRGPDKVGGWLGRFDGSDAHDSRESRQE